MGFREVGKLSVSVQPVGCWLVFVDFGGVDWFELVGWRCSGSWIGFLICNVVCCYVYWSYSG